MRRIRQMKQNQPRSLVAANTALAFRQETPLVTGNDAGENLMNAAKSTTTTEPSLGRDVLNATRYYLGNRWALLVLSSVAVIAGLSFGGWAWLVAAGLAPVILSTLPCLVMCGLGLCMLCRSGEKQTAARDAADATTSSAALAVDKMDTPPAGTATYRHERADEPHLAESDAIS